MKSISLFLLALCWLFLSSNHSVYAQAIEDDDDYIDDYDYRDEYVDDIYGSLAKEKMTWEEFAQLPFSKQYRKLKKEQKRERIKPYKSDKNMMEELREIIHAQSPMVGFSEFQDYIMGSTAVESFQLDGFSASILLENGFYLVVNLTNHKAARMLPELFENGGVFRLEDYGIRSNDENGKLFLHKNNLFLFTEVLDSGEPSASVRVKLSDWSEITIISVNHGNIFSTELLMDFAKSLNYKDLKRWAHKHKNYRDTYWQLLEAMQKNWPEMNWFTNHFGGSFEGFHFKSQIQNETGEAFTWVRNCPLAKMEDEKGLPADLKRALENGSEIDTLRTTPYPALVYQKQYRNDDILFVRKGQNYVQFPLDDRSDENVQDLLSRAEGFFKLPLNCNELHALKKEDEVIRERMEEEAQRTDELYLAIMMGHYIKQIESRKTHQDLYRFTKESFAKKSKFSFPKSSSLEEDYQSILEDIELQNLTGVMLQKSGFRIQMGMDRLFTRVDGTSLMAEAQQVGKGSSITLTLQVTNQAYPKFFPNLIEGSHPLFLSNDGFLATPYFNDQLSTRMINGLPTSYAELQFMGSLSALAVYISDHSALFITGFMADYPQEYLESLVEQMDADKLLAFAEKHKDLHSDYWEQLERLPTVMGKEKLSFLTENNNSHFGSPGIEGEKLVLTGLYGNPYTHQDGVFHFVSSCGEDGLDINEVRNNEDREESLLVGPYQIENFNANFMRNPNFLWQVIRHQDHPGLMVLHTQPRNWTKSELDSYFKDFFTKGLDCQFFETKNR